MSDLSRCSQLVDATLYLERQDGVSDDGSTISSRVYGAREDGVMDPSRRGKSLKAIRRAFRKPSSSIYFSRPAGRFVLPRGVARGWP